VVKIAHFTTKFAEAALKERTHLLFLIAGSAREVAWACDQRVELFGLRVLVKAVLAFLALTMLLVKAANRHSCLVKVVHELTLVAFLATVAHPMDTDGLLTLLLIYRLVNGPQVSVNVIDGHEPIRLLHRKLSAAITLRIVHCLQNYI
jgi:multisubunit Na+/H+ antiporter MnhF subunit